jgi:glycosyltransferase involved in cell wall biosynthesis
VTDASVTPRPGAGREATLALCLVQRGYFPDDPRARKQVRALLERGFSVDVVCLRRPEQPPSDSWHGARVHRLPLGHRRRGMARYVTQYGAFFASAFLRVSRLHLRRRFAIVQVNTMPDALVFVALVPKLAGARIVLDMHELMPELFGALFGRRRGARAVVGGLRMIERLSVRFANHVLVANPRHLPVLRARTGAKRLSLVHNVPDEETFGRQAVGAGPGEPGDAPLVTTHGAMLERYGVQVFLEALARVARQRPLRGLVLGEGEYLPTLRRLAATLGLDETVALPGWVPPTDAAHRIAAATVGVVPILRDGYMETASPNKLFEYAALEVPIIASDTPGMRAYFSDEAVAFVPPGDSEALAKTIALLLDDPQRRARMVARMRVEYEPIRWQWSKREYVATLMSLAAPGTRPASAAGLLPP